MTADDTEQSLIEWLTQRGHTPDDIEKILKRLRQYDREMNVDSVMDSIGKGSFDLQSIIDEVLGKD